MAESLRQTAQKVVMQAKELLYTTSLTRQDWQMVTAIETALTNQREQYAKLMESGSDGVGGDWGCNEAAAAIRNESRQ